MALDYTVENIGGRELGSHGAPPERLDEAAEAATVEVADDDPIGVVWLIDGTAEPMVMWHGTGDDGDTGDPDLLEPSDLAFEFHE